MGKLWDRKFCMRTILGYVSQTSLGCLHFEGAVRLHISRSKPKRKDDGRLYVGGRQAFGVV